jgi:hypothetical protein
MWRPSERWRSGWDGEFESPLLQRRVVQTIGSSAVELASLIPGLSVNKITAKKKQQLISDQQDGERYRQHAHAQQLARG